MHLLKSAFSRIFLPGLLLVLALSACSSRGPTATPEVTIQATGVALPDKNAAVLVKAEEGGSVVLRGGADLSLPRQSLSANTLVTLRAVDDVPAVPIPFSVVGRGYEVILEGGELVGVGVMTLPLIEGVTADQYDLSPYRWNGRSWERVEGRQEAAGVRLGVTQPGTYALLGSWRLAEASLTLAMPPMEAGQSSALEVKGVYRYRALPAMQHDYVEARLALKRDTSGGAGQINGNDELDATVAETVLWFKPDPAQSEGAIDFNHTFRIDPAALNLPLGSVSQFYASLAVEDSFAPTRKLSTAADYTARVPIRVEGSDVIRPDLGTEAQNLEWHVRLDGKTLLRRPATGTTLSLAEILAQGGLGEYRITLETQAQGTYVAVSNEVTVELALPGTPTPAALAGGATATPWPFGTMPATPTRRSPPPGTPSGLDYPGAGLPAAPRATAAPSATPTPAATATPTRPPGTVFWADKEVLASGECTVLHWNVENVAAVYLDGAGTSGNGSKEVCPGGSTTYSLRVEDRQGNTQNHRVTVTVQMPGESGAVVFTVEPYEIAQGDCAKLTWQATNVKAVYLNDKGVNGVATQQVCPEYTTDYTLSVTDSSGNTITRVQTVWVAPKGSVLIRFWADQYALQAGACTTLHWAVDNVEAVYVRGPATGNAEKGVAGYDSLRACPQGTETYTLRVTASENRTQSEEIALLVGDPGLGSKELIAQGVVTSMSQVDDIDPDTTGAMKGWRIDIGGVVPLFKGDTGCCQNNMTLWVWQELLSGQYAGTVDWPLHPGQLVEFWLSPCTGTACTVFNIPTRFYVKARSG